MFEDSNTKDNKVRIRTADIPTSWLNARCRNLISKYALIAFRNDGVVFDLRSDTILLELSKHAKATAVEELGAIYKQLKSELRLVVSAPSFKTALNIMAEKLSYMEGNALH